MLCTVVHAEVEHAASEGHALATVESCCVSGTKRKLLSGHGPGGVRKREITIVLPVVLSGAVLKATAVSDTEDAINAAAGMKDG